MWHGWTSPANADAYERLLRNEIFGHIGSQEISGYRGIQLLRRAHPAEVEFVTMMWFDDLDGIRAFAGDDHTVAVVPPSARQLLSRFDERSTHFEVRENRTGLTG